MKNIEAIRHDFPILKRTIHGHSLIYLDNAATSQKPKQVLDAIVNFYSKHYANVQRGIYTLGEESTELYEQSRTTIARFINADSSEIIFTRGCTEGINFVATAWGDHHIRAGDEVVVSEIEHHSNLVPWQQLVKRHGAILKVIPIDCNTGMLKLDKLDSIITKKTKLVAVSHSSNAIGTKVAIEPIIEAAHDVGALVLVDAAQTVPRKQVDVKKLNCDFCVFSGHKMLGPTGIGVLYVNAIVQDSISPYQFGGGMILDCTMQEAFWRKAPQRYEAGTPPIAQVIGLGAAIDYLEANIKWEELWVHEAQLCVRLIEGLESLKGIRILGPVEQLKKKGHLVSFIVDTIHPHDIACYADRYAICIRAGNHCAQPLFRALNLPGSVRASFYCYNVSSEIDSLIHMLEEVTHKKHFK